MVPTNLSERRRIVSYSDGEGSEAGVGVALWESGTQVVRAGGPSCAGRSSDTVGSSEKLGLFQ